MRSERGLSRLCSSLLFLLFAVIGLTGWDKYGKILKVRKNPRYCKTEIPEVFAYLKKEAKW